MTLRSASLPLLVLLLLPGLAAAQAAQDLTLVAPDGQSVVIDRDAYGVPHIAAPTETALFFGQGFAVAQDRLFQMETFWRAATGRLSEIQGAAALTQDKQVRTVYYTPAERQAQFTALSGPVQTMMTAYVAGINAYIDSTASNPAVYKPYEYTQLPLNQVGIERWDQDKLVAVLQLFMRRFGEIGGEELTRMAELDAQGAEWFEANRPINDPSAPTTIRVVLTASVTHPPASLDRYPAGAVAFARAASEATQQIKAETDATLSGLGVPLKFGSFAAVVAPSLSESGHALLLGAPQMGAPAVNQKAVTSEVELTGPGGLHLAGMTVPGIPGIIIGRTAGRAWTLTTGYTDNVDTYLETLTSASTYSYGGQDLSFQPIQETFHVLGGAAESYTHLRTVHGPVYFQDPNNQFVAAWKYTFWKRELGMVEAFYAIWRAGSVDDFQAAAARVTMSFNLFYADDTGEVAYWHVGKYPVRPGTVDPRLPAMGDGSEEWVGEIPFAAQPQQRNPPQGFFVNWNNKPAPDWPQGDNVTWAPGRGHAYDGVTFLDAYLQSVGDISFEQLQQLPRVVRSNGTYDEYPGTYQQVIEFGDACTARAENVIPPGQSGFVDAAGVPSPNFADQWALYQSSTVDGDVVMKPFTYGGATVCTAGAEAPSGAGFGLSAPAPNPAVGRASLTMRLEAPSHVHVTLVDALGREVAVLADAAMAAGETPVSVATRALAPGVYVVRAVADGRVATRRLVVTR